MKTSFEKELPKDIEELVLRRVDLYWGGYVDNGYLVDQFDWVESEEGFDFWDTIDDGDFDFFYKRYPKKDDSVLLTIIKEEDLNTREELIKSHEESYDFVNPTHYKSMSKEVIDMMEDIWGAEKLIAHCEMCAFKYRMRLGSKPEQPIERDLGKAKWYEDKANELKSK